MAAYRPVCRTDELKPGIGRRIEIDGREIALFRVDGELYAIENTCLHAGGPLHEGRIEGREVICPWHLWRFDLQTGACGLHTGGLATYPVRVRNGAIEIDPSGA